MFGNKSNKPSPIDSLIGAGSTITGDVHFTGGLRVDGCVIGNIKAVGDKPGTLVLSEMAKIEGEIDVGHIVINGTVAGTAGGTDHFGFTAQRIGAFKSGGVATALTPGPGNNDKPLGTTGDVRIHEVAV